jgi:hypothetical protein
VFSNTQKLLHGRIASKGAEEYGNANNGNTDDRRKEGKFKKIQETGTGKSQFDPFIQGVQRNNAERGPDDSLEQAFEQERGPDIVIGSSDKFEELEFRLSTEDGETNGVGYHENSCKNKECATEEHNDR